MIETVRFFNIIKQLFRLLFLALVLLVILSVPAVTFSPADIMYAAAKTHFPINIVSSKACVCVFVSVAFCFIPCVRRTNLEDEQYEEEQQDDLNADDKQLREEVSQHRLQRTHAWYRNKDTYREKERERETGIMHYYYKTSEVNHH